MQKILISILSDYLQPNFLLIKEMSGKYDKLIFITTSKMMELDKGLFLEKALGIQESSSLRISVVEDDLEDLNTNLKENNFSNSDEYIINLTGGTKIMSIGVYNFFKDFAKSSFYYIPFGKNIVKEIGSNNEYPIKYRINLLEYFTINGIRFKADNELLHPERFTNELFRNYKRVNFNRRKLPSIRDAHLLPDSNDKSYYSGRWFEEYIFNRLKRELNLKEEFICKSANLYRDKATNNSSNNGTENDNEVDVMLIKDNQLYVFECKISMYGKPNSTPKETIENYLYKLAAISKDLGLKINSYIFTLHKIYNSPKFNEQSLNNLNKRTKILGIKGIFDNTHFVQQTIKL